jgi:hypothetical protein
VIETKCGNSNFVRQIICMWAYNAIEQKHSERIDFHHQLKEEQLGVVVGWICLRRSCFHFWVSRSANCEMDGITNPLPPILFLGGRLCVDDD